MARTGHMTRWSILVVVLAALGMGIGVREYRGHHLLVTGADLSWKPGSNHPGPTLGTHLAQREAQALAAAINQTPRQSDGHAACPADFGSSVTIRYNTTTGRHPHQVVMLTGCSGPPGHQMTEQLQHLLDQNQPHGFQKM